MTYLDLHSISCKVVCIVYSQNNLQRAYFFLLAEKPDLKSLSKLGKTHYLGRVRNNGAFLPTFLIHFTLNVGASPRLGDVFSQGSSLVTGGFVNIRIQAAKLP